MSEFPLRPPNWPGGVERPPIKHHTGIDYDTSWARRHPARMVRALIVDGVLRPTSHLLASPNVTGLDRLVSLHEPAIFAANHQSHLDTPLMLSSIPARWRHKIVVTSAADYFFTNRFRSAVSALAIGAIPIERQRISRRSTDQAAALLDAGWSLLIFPEGGRSSDGWAQAFRGGAAYLALRCNRPIVPVHLGGTRRAWKKGSRVPKPVGRFGSGPGVAITFGSPLYGRSGEDARRLGVRIERAVAALADERSSDWWTARKRAAANATPSLAGPETSDWRRSWELTARNSVEARAASGATWPGARR